MNYTVKVIDLETREVVRSIDCGNSESKADKVEMGVLRNLNHEAYFTEIAVEDDA